MGQFKPMVKMMTNEPSVILKLKKGGKVASKADGGFMPMQSTQPAGMPARGGMAPAAAPMKPSMAARRRAMNPNLMKKGGKADSKHEDAAQDRAMIKKALAGKKFADGGNVTASMAKTTVKDGVSKFAKTDMETADKTTKTGSTGGVKKGNAGGYAAGGTIKGNVAKFAKTDMETADRTTKTGSTGVVKKGNGGGYADGGTIKGGCWENRPADTAKPGKSGGSTGGVRKGNAGGYKEGGAAKKAYATGGKVDSGKAQAMPKKPVSRPVANSLQSGTFKKGGKVGKYADGDLVDASKGAYDKSIGPDEGDMDMAKAIRSVPRKLFEGAKSLFGAGKTAGAGRGFVNPKSVTKTEESVTVEPRKRGGRC
jgi:hypothetical protein